MEKNQLIMIHGTDYADMTVKLLRAADLASIIGPKSTRIAVKPNLVVEGTADRGAVTHPEIVDGVLRYLAETGFDKVSVIEGSWVGSRTSEAFEVSGIADVCRRRGVPFYDLQRDGAVSVNAAGMQLQICKKAHEAEFLINLPVFKGHCQTLMTCALKNAKGLIPNSEKRRFHTMGLHKPIAHLSAALPRQFIVVDNICGDLDFEEGGNPVTMNRIFAALDPVLTDAYVCESMGFDISEVPYIGMAERLGIGTADTSKADIIMLNRPEAATSARSSGRVRSLGVHVDARDACSACYGSLIYALYRLEEQGRTRGRREKICIGQGFRGKGGGIGVGACTGCFERSLAGCPPKASDMVEFLKNNWK